VAILAKNRLYRQKIANFANWILLRTFIHRRHRRRRFCTAAAAICMG
jgi:hypothetical protein